MADSGSALITGLLGTVSWLSTSGRPGSGWGHAGHCACARLLCRGDPAPDMSDFSVRRRRGHIWMSRSFAAHACVSWGWLRKRSPARGLASAPPAHPARDGPPGASGVHGPCG